MWQQLTNHFLAAAGLNNSVLRTDPVETGLTLCGAFVMRTRFYLKVVAVCSVNGIAPFLKIGLTFSAPLATKSPLSTRM